MPYAVHLYGGSLSISREETSLTLKKRGKIVVKNSDSKVEVTSSGVKVEGSEVNLNDNLMVLK